MASTQYQYQPMNQRNGRSRVWSYPDDHLFFRASPAPTARRGTRSHRSLASRVIFNEDEDDNFNTQYNDSGSYTRMKSSGTSGVSTITELFSGVLFKGKEREKAEYGALEKVQDMPYDVLYEIFSHLHPLDLLNLSRTTHLLRSILIHPSSAIVWRTSLASVRALPVCPNDISEVKYASLAFDDWCHFCLKSGVEQISWTCRVRCCEKCIEKEFITQAELELWMPEEVFIERPDSIFPYILPCRPNNNSICGPPLYLLSKAKSYLAELDRIIDTRSETTLAKWSETKRVIQAEKLTHAALCDYWVAQWSYKRLAQPPTSYASEIGIVIMLIVLLLMMWRQQMWALSLQVARLITDLGTGPAEGFGLGASEL